MALRGFDTLSDGDLASVFFLLTAIAYNLRRHAGLPRVSFVNVWATRIFCSSFFSFLTNALSENRKPFPLLIVTSLLAIFLIESIKLWNLTGIFTKIDIPIFPRFRQSDENFIWPIGKFFDKTRNSILKSGFREKALLKLGNSEQFVGYSPIFYSNDHHSRLQIIFDSLRIGRPFLNCTLTSFARDGRVIVTNNLHTIFASFYPQSWDAKRYPMLSVEGLLRVHASRIAKEKIVKIDSSNSLEAINSEYHRIELENCESGLCEKLVENTNITLTFFGRYLLWRDMLTYTYLGKNF
ncbi:MAG: hypothetical protein LBB18_03495 [Puniceicoccales bacterium]|jgi:hypothetical protein|nr:hypothetical protein [Puniceicoccales bacterium]